MIFYLGTHKPHWLQHTAVPLFISAMRLREQKTWKRARGSWALDSGAFSEILAHGRHRTDSFTYIEEARRWRDQIGRMDWAAIQDWMCEPFMLAKTGFTVRQHQRLTLDNWHRLSGYAPDVPWMPVLQGYEPDEYLAHAEQYEESGVDLAALPRVGVGSVCRRQRTKEGLAVLEALAPLGLKLHGFGFKVTGLAMGGAVLLASADSMAWSRGIREQTMPGCTHASCANCRRYALWWRRHRVLRAIRNCEQTGTGNRGARAG